MSDDNHQQSAFDNGLNGAHLFINVPPEERNPASLGQNNTAYATHIQQYNGILADYVADFANRNPSASVLMFDAHSWFNSVLDNASHYGFKNITG
jgi:phospholipase/lecithinase/hemolysin